MAISGGAVPCAIFHLDNGRLQTYYFNHANGSIVEDDMDRAFQEIVRGKRVYVYRIGLNVPHLSDRIRRYLASQESKGVRGGDLL